MYLLFDGLALHGIIRVQGTTPDLEIGVKGVNCGMVISRIVALINA